MAKNIPSSVQNEFEREESRKWKPIFLALLGSFFSHVLLYLFIPETLMIMASDPTPQTWQEFDIILAEEEPEIMKQYVPINREDVSNEPDETDYFASKDAQAANEELRDDLNEDTPFIDGESEEFNNLVQGQPNLAPPSPSVPPLQANQNESRPQQNPSIPQIRINRPRGEDELNQQRPRAPLAFEDEQEDFDSPRSFPEIAELSKDEEAQEIVESEEEVEEDATQLDQGIFQDQRPLTPPEKAVPDLNFEERPARLPQPRVRYANTGPLKKNMSGVSRIAQMANYSAEFSEFGEYLDRMFETIEIEWHNLLSVQRMAERRSRVSIAFYLDAEGEITDWEIVDATSSLQAQVVCAAAVNNRAPFGDWTEEMVNTLKDPERVIVNFLFY